MGFFQKLFGGHGKYNAMLAVCNLKQARYEIIRFHEFANEQAAKEGSAVYFKEDYAAAWTAFRDDPTVARARAVLNTAPHLLEYFEESCPGGKYFLGPDTFGI